VKPLTVLLQTSTVDATFVVMPGISNEGRDASSPGIVARYGAEQSTASQTFPIVGNSSGTLTAPPGAGQPFAGIMA
jgi:hypothetical protein